MERLEKRTRTEDKCATSKREKKKRSEEKKLEGSHKSQGTEQDYRCLWTDLLNEEERWNDCDEQQTASLHVY